MDKVASKITPDLKVDWRVMVERPEILALEIVFLGLPGKPQLSFGKGNVIVLFQS